MDALDNDHNGLVQRSVRKKPPKHYKLSINSFSSLKSKEKYESNEFEAGGYKWKLVLFPNGNKNRDVKDHISLYLEMSGEKAIKPRKIVTIDYKLFLLNQLKGKETYMVLEHSNKKKKTYCIYRTIVGGLAGFDRFIPLEDFRDASNGYLLDDACEFGAEVLVSAKTTRKTKGECLFTNLNSTAMFKYVWKVAKFSKLNIILHHHSLVTIRNIVRGDWCSIPRNIPLLEKIVIIFFFFVWIIHMSFLLDRKYERNILYALWIKSMATIVLLMVILMPGSISGLIGARII